MKPIIFIKSGLPYLLFGNIDDINGIFCNQNKCKGVFKLKIFETIEKEQQFLLHNAHNISNISNTNLIYVYFII